MYLINTGLCKNLLRAEGLDEGRAALCCISEWEDILSKGRLLCCYGRERHLGTKHHCWVFVCNELVPDGVFVLKMPRSQEGFHGNVKSLGRVTESKR